MMEMLRGGHRNFGRGGGGGGSVMNNQQGEGAGGGVARKLLGVPHLCTG